VIQALPDAKVTERQQEGFTALAWVIVAVLVGLVLARRSGYASAKCRWTRTRNAPTEYC
jgi:hypothetical protein